MSVASFSAFPSWQSPHEYLQNILTDKIPTDFSLLSVSEWKLLVDCCKVFPGFTYVVNTVGEKGNEVAGHLGKRGTGLCRGRWGQESVEKMSVWVKCVVSMSAVLCHPHSWAHHTQRIMVVVAGRGLWMWFCPSPCSGRSPGAGCPWQDCPQLGFESLRSPKQLLALDLCPCQTGQNPSEGRFLQRGFVRPTGPQKVLDACLNWGMEGAEFQINMRKNACSGESRCKCEHLLGLVVPSKKFLLLTRILRPWKVSEICSWIQKCLYLPDTEVGNVVFVS